MRYIDSSKAQNDVSELHHVKGNLVRFDICAGHVSN